jgi:hypothetical protein
MSPEIPKALATLLPYFNLSCLACSSLRPHRMRESTSGLTALKLISVGPSFKLQAVSHLIELHK